MAIEIRAGGSPRPSRALRDFRLGAMAILVANVILDQVGFFLAEKASAPCNEVPVSSAFAPFTEGLLALALVSGPWLLVLWAQALALRAPHSRLLTVWTTVWSILALAYFGASLLCWHDSLSHSCGYYDPGDEDYGLLQLFASVFIAWPLAIVFTLGIWLSASIARQAAATDSPR
jgi:hypothetical protein